MKTWKLTLEYDGTRYSGWQEQSNARTIAGELHKAAEDFFNRQVEIGATFLARGYWRTPANTEAKYLFLRHCFESLGCVRVALKTDGRNVRSQEAIARLGALREGTLRRHMNVRGYQRDTVYFSILADEWPTVKTRLEDRLQAG